MKTQKTRQRFTAFQRLINPLWMIIFFTLAAITLVQSQPIEFCGVFPPHQATSNNPDSIYWDRFGNSYDIGFEEPSEFNFDRSRQICGYFDLTYLNLGHLSAYRSTICAVFEMLSDSIQRRINVSFCGDTIQPSNIILRITGADLDDDVLASASGRYVQVNAQEACIELFENLVYKKINGSQALQNPSTDYDGRLFINNDTSINWYAGSGNAPNGYYDFFSVILHEAGHLLGIASRIDTTGFESGSISLWDKLIHLTPYYQPEGQSEGLVPLLVSDCETGCHSLNDTLFSGFSALDSALINNCNETGSIDFVIGNPALAPIYGGILNSNNLSHLQPICNDDSVKYVMQRTISDLIPDNQRRSFTKSETEIFCKLGYKWGECDECYFSSHSELIEYSENMPSDPIFYACVDDTVVVPFRELLCNDYTNGTYPEITFWEESAGVTVIKGDSVFYVISNFKGTHEVYYRVAGCDCHVLNSIFYVNYISCFDCSSIDPCVNLTCVNGFEQFSPETGSIVAHLELSDGPYWVYENTDKNSVDICTSADQNTYINLGGFIKNLEGLCLKLSEPILPGCKVKVNLDAASNNQSAEMRIHMSKHPPCNFTDTRISIECLQTNCGDYTFTPICVDTIKISNAQTQEGGLCSPYPNLQPIETFYWKNSTQDTLHYIIFSPTINERSIRLDDILVQQLCLDPDFSFDYLEQCNEVIFTSIDTNSTNSHFWYFGDDSTSTLMHPTHLFEKSDTFLVTHILTDYCGNADTSMLNVIINDEVTECCPDTTLSVGTTWTPSTVLPGDGRFHIITLEQGVSLSIEDGLVLEFCEGGALVIESGAYASLDGTLTSYGDMTWQGVFVEGDTSQGQHINLGNGGFHGLQQGLIHTREGSMIKNAKIGIRNYGLDGDASTGGMIRCEETSFINNTIGVDFGPYQNYSTDGIPKSSLGTFRNCTFNTDTTYHLHEPFNAFVKMRKADGMRFAGCSFTNEILPELPSEVSEFGFGIHSVSSGFMVYAGNSTAATPICPHPCVVGDSTTFKGLGHGIYVLTQDKTQPYSVYHAQFENCFRGITSVGSTGGTMLFNTFRMGEVPDTDFSYGQIGVELHFNHEGFELQENIFDRIEGGSNLNTIGILVNTLGGNDNVIRRNTFRGIESANQAFGVNADLTPDIQRGLIYLCNNIDTTLSQGYDFHIPNTPALDVIHPFQTPGAPNGQEISAGNHFAYTALDFMNYSQDTINYFFNPIGQNEQPRDSFSIGIVDIEADENECETSYCAFPCLSVIQDAKDDYFEGNEDLEEATEDFLTGIATQNLTLTNLARSKALFFRKAISKAAYTVVTHMMIDTLDYNSDSLVTWLGYMDTYGAELLIAGQYASKNDYESAIDILETISIRRSVSTEQESDIENLIEIYNLLDGKLIGTFNAQDRSSLRSIAYANIGFSSGVARALLSYFGEYIPLPFYIGNQIEFRSIESPMEEEKEEKTEFTQLKIYPNPAREQLTVEWNANEFSSNSIEIINMQGEKVAHRRLTYTGMEVFDTSTWPNGIYLIINRDELGRIATGKAIILKD